eukprot:UC4_evm1s187
MGEHPVAGVVGVDFVGSKVSSKMKLGGKVALGNLDILVHVGMLDGFDEPRNGCVARPCLQCSSLFVWMSVCEGIIVGEMLDVYRKI